MNDDLLPRIAADLNSAPLSGARAARVEALVADTNIRIAKAAVELPFDSTPYGFPQWLAALDAFRQQR